MKQLIALIMIVFLVPTTTALAKSPCQEDKVLQGCEGIGQEGQRLPEGAQRRPGPGLQGVPPQAEAGQR